MKYLIVTICLLIPVMLNGQTRVTPGTQEANKQLVLKFYNDLWHEPHTDRYADYVAEQYIVHDIGDRKGATEPAVEQKNIADFFWAHGDLDFELDYQVADGDLVATRWVSHFTPRTIFGKWILGEHSLPIINVVRIKEGKIVEFWNHRHDIDTSQTLSYTLKGLGIGLLAGIIPLILMIRYKRKLNAMNA